ncbi:MBL fold metallo-hydrolase [Pontibacillus yanchengensis]|uniref:MBL fold metallo-hydrolase n=2 Tax=Pontibacillus yanchengensis TaxID=462910 RepID=A0ACC7VBZ4_9BACI|nr:MBL fold metallo-hydrolase [Pontibacillus yanchengensis]MYL34736.1 MBL fold metallo-hydrolase [Pontibacillus yanchengensis]MYL52278.1 MBL fold metallo-hydrolase [Pontibacillus yanchengensis]
MSEPLKAQQVANKVLNQKPLFILDVRNESEFQDWKIEGNSVEIINKPYFDLLEGVDHILDELPKENVLVVCAKEGSSIMVADMLDEAGLKEVYYLEGGMKAWSEYLEPIKVGDLSDGGELYQFVRLGKGCLSYMVISQAEAMIIDANRMIQPYLDFAEDHGLTIKHVADTHLHADHISGGRKIAEEVDAAYWLPPKDAPEATFHFESLEDQKEIQVGNTNIQVEALYTPGHTIGSTSFVIDNQYLLSGDILFVKSIGRPDLAGKAEDWVGDLRNSLYNRYKELSEELLVLPAHFGSMDEMQESGIVGKKLGELYKDNKGLQVDNEQDFRRMVTENLPPQPNSHEEIRQVNMGKLNPDEERQREMEIGPNRCAVSE